MAVISSRTYGVKLVDITNDKKSLNDENVAKFEILIKSGDDAPLSSTSTTKPVSKSKSPEVLPVAPAPAPAPVHTPDLSTSTETLPRKILRIIQSYGQNEPDPTGSPWLGMVKFDPIVQKHVADCEPIKMVLPAFPWKSVNKVDKVLGRLPDFGEELALARLNQLCNDIGEIYEYGAEVTITSDGLVYSDLVGIEDEEVFEYGAALREMAVQKRFTNIKFTRIMDLLGLNDKATVSKSEYLSLTAECRKQLMERYLPAGFDAREELLQNQDANTTYCGYIIFLTKDLQQNPKLWADNTSNEVKRTVSNQEYRRRVKRVALDMITRGKEDSFSKTPWHTCVLVTASGQFRTEHAMDLREKHELVHKNGRPYFFREKSAMWDWKDTTFEYFYPKGLIIQAEGCSGDARVLSAIEEKHLESLSKVFSPVIVKGFA
ncbi:putative transferase family protein [Botrytis fragariae]|uniref:Putative transferase family protein n=1 Tax=Botrytis fragariae TaxID=1964551 RepID=A0A8H6B2J3_9HELO|nr:putative transferase family protein [Botrytis fragariae]KAF5878166.1 putative transferase family protein [Botrytis fragariae]